MAGNRTDPKIYLAFRFHANFYHSYRGDTNDELGFGKDIRIIRNTIEVLDSFNAKGVPARGTWDIENYFSLEKIMPEHCPDIIESLKRRVAEGKDEVQVMSHNNGLISAHTADEFDLAIGQAISNSEGSGLKDLFSSFGPMVRPQEMMYTPIHLKMYPPHGINNISLFYSSVPFNGFSNFMRLLPFEQRYNPLTLTYPGVEGSMTLVPAYNHGDIADNITLKWWVKRLRRKQLSMSEPKDLLLILDADADDEFWYGMNWPIVSSLLATARGLRGLIESVCDLDYVTFTTPSEYVQTHPAVGTITIGQDTADGSFDGHSSWAEKWDNHRIWTGIERSRILELQTRRLMDSSESDENRKEAEQLLDHSRELRLRALSTTHFGLASPVMNVTRLKTGAQLVGDAVNDASRAFDLIMKTRFGNSAETGATAAFALIDYVRGVSTAVVNYAAKPSRALVRIPFSPTEGMVGVKLKTADGEILQTAIRHKSDDLEVLFIEHMDGGDQKNYRIDPADAEDEGQAPQKPVSAKGNLLENEFVTVRFDEAMQPTGLACSGVELADGPFLRSGVNYRESVMEAARWELIEGGIAGNGLIGFLRTKSEIVLTGDGVKRVLVEREYLLASGLPYLYVDTHIAYPETRSDNYSESMARQLQREYDNDWREVMPCELRPALFGKKGSPLRVWKHNYCDHVSSYDVNYAEFSKNVEIDSFNNHVTHAWVAVTDGAKGLLVAQTADVNSSHAFCPMRTRTAPKGLRILLNPFGSYYGKQLNYMTAFSGLGKFIALKMADSLDPHAPSYNGRTESFRLLIAPYAGDKPPEDVMNDAEAFAYPYAVVSMSGTVGVPEHRQWKFDVK